MNKCLPDWLAFAIASSVLAFFGLGFFSGNPVYAATESASVSGIKALYGEEAATRGASLEPQTLSNPTGDTKPSLEVIGCPDGVSRSALEILTWCARPTPSCRSGTSPNSPRRSAVSAVCGSGSRITSSSPSTPSACTSRSTATAASAVRSP